MKSAGNFLTSETNQGMMDIYVSAPDAPGKYPVVIVLMEAFGVNGHIRKICNLLADEGFLALAPDLYHRHGRKIVIDYSDRKEMMPLLGSLVNSDIIKDVRTTINFSENLPGADVSTISTIGFCVGGFASALCATKLNIKKMISFYGAGMVHPRDGLKIAPILEDLKNIKSDCLFFFGGQDASIPSNDIHEIEKKLTARKVKFEVDIFQNADHGFFCDERKVFDQEAASIAWKKTLAFLKN